MIIEKADLLFAIDSIPAVLAISSDYFIVITSNIFAILGLRSLYLLLSGIMEKFYYLKPALVLLLFFIGTKMLLSDVYKMPVLGNKIYLCSFTCKQQLEQNPSKYGYYGKSTLNQRI
ncbi:MAG TPA: hypothetical protein VF047_08685 [Nitrososphaeraceae archaeon]